MILEASQAGSRERANFQQEIMRTPKIILGKLSLLYYLPNSFKENEEVKNKRAVF